MFGFWRPNWILDQFCLLNGHEWIEGAHFYLSLSLSLSRSSPCDDHFLTHAHGSLEGLGILYNFVSEAVFVCLFIGPVLASFFSVMSAERSI